MKTNIILQQQNIKNNPTAANAPAYPNLRPTSMKNNFQLFFKLIESLTPIQSHRQNEKI